MHYLRPWILGCAALPLLLAGCKGNNNPATYPVTGVVKFKGQPLANVIVTFFPTDGRPAAGKTDGEGRFTLTTFQPGDGALPGNHKVTVAEPAPEMAEGDYSVPEAKPPAFPVTYTDQRQTDLTFEVKAGGENDFTIELKE